MSYSMDQEKAIIDCLSTVPQFQEDLIEDLRALKKGKTKSSLFSNKGKNAKTDRSLLAKAERLSYEAILNGVMAVFPKDKRPKPTVVKVDKRAEMFANFSKMDDAQKNSPKVQAAIEAAQAFMKTREEAKAKAASTRAKNNSKAS